MRFASLLRSRSLWGLLSLLGTAMLFLPSPLPSDGEGESHRVVELTLKLYPGTKLEEVEVEASCSGHSFGTPVRLESDNARARIRVPTSSPSAEIRGVTPGFFSERLLVGSTESAVLKPLWIFPAAAVEATASDTANGQARGEVRVRFLEATTAEGPRSLEGVCAFQKSGRLLCPGPAGTWHPLFSHLETAGLAVRWFEQLTPGRTQPLGLLRFEAASALWVPVVDSRGAPVAGVELRVRRQLGLGRGGHSQGELPASAEVFSAKTNDWGYAILSELPGGLYEVASRVGEGPVTSRTDIVLDVGAVQVLEPPLRVREPVSVRVRIEPPAHPSGTPLEVLLWRPSGAPALPFEPVTSIEGEWARANLAPGRYFLEVRDRGGQPVVLRELTLESDQEVTVPLDWTLVRGNLRQGRQELSGRLTFRGRGDWRGSRLEVGLSSGTWELWLPSPGPWGLDYVGEGGLWVPEIPVEVRSRGDSHVSELLVELQEIRLSGRVVDREGKAVPAAEVELGALEGALAAALATTDTAGRFELILPREGRFQLQARAVGKDGVRFSAPEPVRLEAAAVDDEIVLAVEPPERLEVRLEGLPAGSRPEFWWIP